jgi:hypothetical protein
MKYLENILDYCTYIVGVLYLTLSFTIFILSTLVVAAISITAIERGLRKLSKS